MSQLEAPAISGSQQHPLLPSSPGVSSPVHAYHPTLSVTTTQENTATIYDFLSLCGTALGRSTSTATKPDSGSQQLSSTQDFLQPQQNTLIPARSSTNSRPNGYAAGPPKTYNGSNEYNGGQYSCHAFGNGGFEPKENFASKYGAASLSFGPRGHVAPALPITKHWPQQASGEVFDGNKRLLREPSEEDDDEDDEQFEHIFSAKKDGRYQKDENSQAMDGRSQDKGITPRSKHSATEQRRRSKINDRFQMLRQLLPIADQKRDKASFLLEVIEYIQMLHEKVKQYEALEFRGQNQDQTKTLTWNRSSGQEDVTLSPLQDMKEVSNANGYGRSQLSPLTVVSEDGRTLSVPMCTTMQASALQGVLNLESKSVIAKSLPLNLSQAPSSMIPDQASNHLHQSIFPENRTFFTQFLRQEQAATKARDMSSEKTEAGHPHVQQSCQAEDQHFPCSRRMDNQNLSALMFRRSEKEIEGQDVASQVTESGSISGNCINKPSVGLDGRNVPGCSEVSRIEQRTEALPAEEQEAPVVLGGVINISSTYSQGLLDTLTRALQSSGVDMAQATISVKIDLGKPESSDSKQMLSLSTGISFLQNKQTMSTNESEPPPYKKLKVESV